MKPELEQNTEPANGRNTLLCAGRANSEFDSKMKSTDLDLNSQMTDIINSITGGKRDATMSGLSNLRNIKGDKVSFIASSVNKEGVATSDWVEYDKKTYIESRFGRQSDYHIPVEEVENAKEFLWNIISPSNRDFLLELSKEDYFIKPDGKVISHVNLEIKLEILRIYNQNCNK